MIWMIIDFLMYLFIFSYILTDLIFSIRNIKYQKKWNEEKAKRIKIDPAITRAELCEQYAMFCKRNNCLVEF
jgi:hypothetical protein